MTERKPTAAEMAELAAKVQRLAVTADLLLTIVAAKRKLPL